jgi:ribosome recycling factor
MAFEAELADAKSRMEKALTALANDFKHIRTGRAVPSMIEHVQVDAYGSMMPITQCASISVPEPTQLLIKPWDKGLIKHIERALGEAQLGMIPQSDGQVIRLNVPPLSTERRAELAGKAKEAAEKCKVSMRNVRRDVIKAIETKGKADKSPEDAIKKSGEKVSDLLKTHEGKADAALKEKTDDIMRM